MNLFVTLSSDFAVHKTAKSLILSLIKGKSEDVGSTSSTALYCSPSSSSCDYPTANEYEMKLTD